jgi:hypothetical protein
MVSKCFLEKWNLMFESKSNTDKEKIKRRKK